MKIVKMAELKKTPEYQKLSYANEALLKYIMKNYCRVERDHCHWTGEFRGTAHNHCNRQYRTTYKIPVFFHYMPGYDEHIIFEKIAKLDMKKPPTGIAKSLEKYQNRKP